MFFHNHFSTTLGLLSVSGERGRGNSGRGELAMTKQFCGKTEAEWSELNASARIHQSARCGLAVVQL